MSDDAMDLADLQQLRDDLNLLIEAGARLNLLSRPPRGDGVRFAMTPGHDLQIKVGWRLPVDFAPAAAPDFPLIEPEDAAPVVDGPVAISDSAAQPRAAAPVAVPSLSPPCASPVGAAPEAAPAGAFVADRSGAPWTPEEDARIASLRADGLTLREIAGQTGRSEKSLSVRYYKTIKPALDAQSNTSGPAAAVRKPAKPVAPMQGPDRAAPLAAPETVKVGPARAPVGSVSKPAPVAGGAGDHSGMPGGERGGLQQHSPAEKAPVQAGGVRPPAEAAPRPAWWRDVEANLRALGCKGGWNAAADLALVEGFAAGQPAEVIADQCGFTVSECRARFIAMTPDAVEGRGRRHVTPEMQEQLLAVLRARAKGGAA